jgi:hypothetical protein
LTTQSKTRGRGSGAALDQGAAGTARTLNSCTIIANKYVAHAQVLARSLAKRHPEGRLSRLIIDDFSGYIDPADEPFEVLTPEGSRWEEFPLMTVRYSLLELSTAVKPWLLRHLMDVTGAPVTYLDPAIKVYASLQLLVAHPPRVAAPPFIAGDARPAVDSGATDTSCVWGARMCGPPRCRRSRLASPRPP